jgi:endonuclease YncB( thermonuclease family)
MALANAGKSRVWTILAMRVTPYGRLLRYVAAGHTTDIGLAMIRSGWASCTENGSHGLTQRP